MKKFLAGLFLGTAVGAGGTVIVLCRSTTVRTLAKAELSYRIREAAETFLYGPTSQIDPADFETFVEYKAAREAEVKKNRADRWGPTTHGRRVNTPYGPARFSR